MRLFFLLLGVSSLAIADDAAILRCRTVTESVARLACYDALVITPAVNNSRTDAATGKVVAPAVAASTSTLQAQKSSQFGLEEKAAKKDELDAIDSHIVGSFEGWRAGSNIRLANGQVWQVTDDSSRAHYIDNPKVRIRRGALGAFYLEIQGTNHSPRVKRVQ
jgi:hypothetical protein